jgi:uncharacterized damage-inducible protein DinB
VITPSYCRLMAGYNAEMNRRLYAAADGLDDAARRSDLGAFFGSVHATLSHLLWGDLSWISRFDGGEGPDAPFPGLTIAPEWERLKSRRVELDARIEAWAAGVSADWLNGDLTWFSGAAQRSMSMPAAPIVIHMFNHQTHHRGQVHALLTRLGAKPADTDLAFILPEALLRG